MLLEELDTLETNLVVALGANALWALTGEKAISKFRGSLFMCKLPSGREIKVLATYHPAAILRQWDWKAAFEFDLVRAVEEAKTPDLVLPEREYHIAPTYEEAMDYCNINSDLTGELSYDIECQPGKIMCIAYSRSPNEAICIPTTTEYWGSTGRLKNILDYLRHAMSPTRIEKVGQNISFDIQYIMRFFTILPTRPWFDTMIAQHACYSEMPKGLAFLTSIYTKEPYYKDELKVWQGKMSDLETLWTYNCKDAAVTLECKHELEKEMADLGVRHTYDYMMGLLEPLLFMMLRGVRIDVETLAWHQNSYQDSLAKREAHFATVYPGINPHSSAQIRNLVYNTLGLPPVLLKGKPTANADALEKLAVKHPDVAEVLGIRKDRKMLSTYIDVPVDPVDKRMRFSLNSTGAETGRLSSSGSVFGSGTNLSNWPKKIRDTVVPEPGMVFTQADLKGAEALVVMYESGDEVGIKMMDEGKNIHIHTATDILWPGLTEEDILEDQKKGKEEGRDPIKIKYDIAKRIRHLCNYMGSYVAIQRVLKCTAPEAKRYIAVFMAKNPQIPKWHNEVKDKLNRDRIIITCLGRKRIFFGRWGQELIREAIAYGPQETVAHVLNIGLKRVYEEICVHPKVNIINPVYDSILLEHPPEMASEIHARLHELMKVELTIKGRTFSIPVDIEMGKNWRDMEKVK